MISRFAVVLATIAVVIAVACVDMSAPKGAASISQLQMPQPAVVAGDTLRDSTGAVAQLDIVSFDGAGAPIAGQTPKFFITDTTRRAHLTGATRILVGDSIGLMHLAGQVGDLTTPVVNVQVTFEPSFMQKLSPIDTSLLAPLGADSSSSIGSVPLAAALRAANDSASQGFIVQYKLRRAPATRSDKRSPAVFLADDQGNIATSDTSDATGVRRQLKVVSAFLADPALLGGSKTDTAIVEAHITYKGHIIGPIQWIVPIRVGVVFK